jgi:hypothetical protein
LKKILQIFQGKEGEMSSKRFVGILGAVILYVTFFLNSFTDTTLAPSPELVSAVEWVTILCLGFTSIEKFAK